MNNVVIIADSAAEDISDQFNYIATVQQSPEYAALWHQKELIFRPEFA